MGDLMYTSLRVESKTRNDLEKLKNYKTEPFNSVIERLINAEKNDELDFDEINQIQNSLEDIKKGKTIDFKTAQKEWGI